MNNQGSIKNDPMEANMNHDVNRNNVNVKKGELYDSGKV